MLHKSKPNNVEALDWEELQERVVTTIHLLVTSEARYHVMELKSKERYGRNGRQMVVFIQCTKEERICS